MTKNILKLFVLAFSVVLMSTMAVAATTPSSEDTLMPSYTQYYEEIASGMCGENVQWTMYSNGDLIISGEGPMYDYMEKDQNGTFVEIREQDYVFCSSRGVWTNSILIEDGVTYIGVGAFGQMSNLRYVTIGKGVKSIGDCAFFYNTSLQSVTLSEGLTDIGEDAFGYCTRLSSITLPETLTAIGSMAFCGSALTDITIPDGVTSLGESAFAWCHQLTKATLGNGITALPNASFQGCSSLVSVSLGSAADLGPRAFESCTSLTTVIAPNGITSIGDYAFSHCSALPKLNLPDNLHTMGTNAFYGCTGLTSVTVGSKLATLSSYAFYGCTGLESVTFATDGVGIGDFAFYSCTALRTVSAPSGIGSVGYQAFRGCNALTGISVAQGTVGDAAFSNLPALKRVVLGPDVISVGSGAFNSCAALTEVTVSAGSVGDNAFAGCPSLKTVELGDGVTSVGDYAFRGATALASIVIPDSVTSIGTFAVAECTSLTTAVLGDGCTGLDNALFWGCTSLRKVVLGNSITTIGSNDFEQCTSLTRVQFGTGLETLDLSAFEDCPNLRLLLFLGNAPKATGYISNWDTCEVLYVNGTDGWTQPTWKSMTTRAVEKEDYVEDIFEKGYYGKPKNYRFSFKTDSGASLHQVTATIGAETFHSGENSSLTIQYGTLEKDEVFTFTCEGYQPVHFPAGLLDSFNTIRFSPEGEGDPHVQMLYASTDGENYTDLLRKSLYLTQGALMETIEFYVSVDWGEKTPGSIYLSQTTDTAGAFLLQTGWNDAKNYSKDLTSGSGMYLLLVCGDGTIYREHLSITVRKAQAETIELDLGPSVNIPVSSLELFKEFKFSMDLTDDIKISLTVEPDGTVLGVLGMEAAKEKYVSNLVQSMQDGFSLLEGKSTAKAYDSLEQMLNTFQKSGMIVPEIPSHKSFGVSSKFNAMGYLKGRIVLENGNYSVDITECKVGLLLKGSISKTWQTAYVGVPVYFKGGLEGSAGIATRLYDEDGGFSALVIGSTVLTNKLALKIEAGLGLADIASVGVEGAGELTSTLVLPTSTESILDDYKLWAQATVSLKAKVFCFESDVTILETSKHMLYPKEEATQLLALPVSAVQTAQWLAQSREYLDAGTLLSTASESTGSDVVIADNQYTYAAVAFEILDNGTQVVVWNADDGSRTCANNRTVLYYAYNNGTGWSTPLPVEATDDGTADFSPQLKILDGQLWLFWQDASRAITEDDTYLTTASAMDISCAAFDSANGCFLSMGTVGTDSFDGAISATIQAGMPAVVWAADHASDPFTYSSQMTSLYRAVWDGNVWTTEVLAQGLNSVDQTATDGSNIWYSANDAAGDREIFLYNGTVEQLTDNNVMDSKPEFSNNELFWYSDGAIVTATETISLETSTDRYQYLRSDQGLDAIVYVVTDSESQLSSIYANFNDASGWGQPIRLSGDIGTIGSFCARFASDGSLLVAAMEQPIVDGIPSVGAQLKLYTATPTCDLSLTNVEYLAHTLIQGGDMTMMLDLNNVGMTTTDYIQVTVTDEQSTLLDLVYAFELLSGCQDTLAVTVPIGETLPEELTVTITPIGGEDSDTTNNSSTLPLRLADLSLEGAEAWSDETSTTVTVLAVNRGMVDLSGMTISLTDESGSVLSTANDLSLTVGDSTFVEFHLDHAISENEFLTLEASGLAVENIYANNIAEVWVESTSKPKVPEISLYTSYTVDGSSLNVYATVSNTTDLDCIYTLVFACYDTEGKLLEVRTQAGTAASSSAVDGWNTFNIEPDAIAEIRVFLLDDSFAPLTNLTRYQVK